MDGDYPRLYRCDEHASPPPRGRWRASPEKVLVLLFLLALAAGGRAAWQAMRALTHQNRPVPETVIDGVIGPNREEEPVEEGGVEWREGRAGGENVRPFSVAQAFMPGDDAAETSNVQRPTSNVERCRCGPDCDCDCGPDCDCQNCCDCAVLSGGRGVVEQTAEGGDDYGQLLREARARRDALRQLAVIKRYLIGLACVAGGVGVLVLGYLILGPRGRL